MLAGGTIRVGGAGNATVVLHPTAPSASSGTVAVGVAFDANQPLRRADLPPGGAARGTLLVRAAINDTRITSHCAGARRVEREIRVTAADDRHQADTQGIISEHVHGELTSASASARAKPFG